MRFGRLMLFGLTVKNSNNNYNR